MTWIASETFRCVPRRGKPFDLVARFGLPSLTPFDGSLHPFGVVPISFEPLIPERKIAQHSEFFALCQAIEHLRATMKAFVADGGKIYFPGSENPVDVNSPIFGPLPTLSDLRGRSKPKAPIGRRKKRA